MAILLPLYLAIVDKLLISGANNLTNIKVLVMGKVFWFTVINIFIISYIIRVNIWYFDILPMLYYSYYTYISVDLKNYLFPEVLLDNVMMANNNIRANKRNGSVFVANPFNQLYNYNNHGVNQPLLGKIGHGLEAQRLLGLTSLSKYTFTPEQKHYVLSFLLHKHPDVYNKIMQGQVGNPNEPIW